MFSEPENGGRSAGADLLSCVLDHLAAIARQQGHPLDRIAANVDWMAELLHRIERTSLGT